MKLTPEELIAKLQSASKAWNAIDTLLIVAFGQKHERIRASDEDRLERLEDALRRGGTPVAIMRVEPGQIRARAPGVGVAVQTLEEHVGEPWVKPFLDPIILQLRREFLKNRKPPPPPKR